MCPYPLTSIEATKNSTQTLCSAPVRDESHIVSHAGIAGGVLAVFAYILRMVSRLPYFGGNNLGWDDAIISIAVLEVIPLTVLSVIREYPTASEVESLPDRY